MTLLAPHVIAFMRRAAEWKLSSDTVESAADCALRLIIAVHRSGGYAEALILAREASQLVSEYLGADHVQTLKIQQRVARAQWRLGQFEESRDLYIQVLSKCERVLGIGAQETLDSCNGLSCALRDLGDIAQSFVLQKRIAKNTIKAFGNLHPRALAARSHLIASAGQIADEEDVGEIIAAGVSLIDDCRRTVGDNHQITLSARLDYASALYSTGRAVEALGHVADVHAAFKAHLGLNHSLTLAAQRTYSGSLFLVGRYEEAIALAKDLAERRASVLGPRHPWTVENKELVEKFINAQNETDSQGPRLKNSIGLLQVTILCCFGGSAGSRGR
jgi:tetratricopeptide (TPR) repeat protein